MSRSGFEVAADGARATRAGDDVIWNTSGEVFVTGTNHLFAYNCEGQ